jgi:hypothetical protein
MGCYCCKDKAASLPGPRRFRNKKRPALHCLLLSGLLAAVSACKRFHSSLSRGHLCAGACHQCHHDVQPDPDASGGPGNFFLYAHAHCGKQAFCSESRFVFEEFHECRVLLTGPLRRCFQGAAVAVPEAERQHLLDPELARRPRQGQGPVRSLF